MPRADRLSCDASFQPTGIVEPAILSLLPPFPSRISIEHLLKLVEGTMEVSSREEAIARLKREGLNVLELEEQSGGHKEAVETLRAEGHRAKAGGGA